MIDNQPIGKAITYGELLEALLAGKEAQYREEVVHILTREILKHKPDELIIVSTI